LIGGSHVYGKVAPRTHFIVLQIQAVINAGLYDRCSKMMMMIMVIVV